MPESVTVRLPREALQRFRRGAGAAGKPLDESLADRLLDAMPSLPENLAPALRAELDAFEQLDERQQLEILGDEARQLTLKKAHAYLLLKWRGYEIPSVGQLEGSQ